MNVAPRNIKFSPRFEIVLVLLLFFGFAGTNIGCASMMSPFKSGGGPSPKLTPLGRAAEDGDCEKINALILGDAKVNEQANDQNPETALYIAVMCHKLEAIQLLLQHGANPNLGFTKGSGAPLSLAIQIRYLDATNAMLEKNTTTGHKDFNKDTFLVFLNVNFDELNQSDQLLLTWARLMSMHGASIHAKDRDGCTPLMLAAKNSCLVLVDYFIELGSELSVRNRFGADALEMAKVHRSNLLSIKQEWEARPSNQFSNKLSALETINNAVNRQDKIISILLSPMEKSLK